MFQRNPNDDQFLRDYARFLCGRTTEQAPPPDIVAERYQERLTRLGYNYNAYTSQRHCQGTRDEFVNGLVISTIDAEHIAMSDLFTSSDPKPVIHLATASSIDAGYGRVVHSYHSIESAKQIVNQISHAISVAEGAAADDPFI